MEKSIKYEESINFSSESIDVTMQCSKYLKNKKFYYNNLDENLRLLEKSLINYSIIKLSNWNVALSCLMQLDNLDEICTLINSIIPTNEQKISFFTQYIHCIIYIVGVISGQHNQIDWLVDENTKDEIDIEEVDNQIVKITTRKDIPHYQLPHKLLEKFNSYYKLEEKNPVLKK